MSAAVSGRGCLKGPGPVPTPVLSVVNVGNAVVACAPAG